MDIFLPWHTHDLTDDYGTHEEEKSAGLGRRLFYRSMDGIGSEKM